MHPAAPGERAVSLDACYAIDENPFTSLLVDITDRCNMSCRFCYHSQSDRPDMSLSAFEDLCARLPFPVALKLAGGEPTLHPALEEFIHTGVRHGHTVYVASNGLRYAEPDFVSILVKIRDSGTHFCLGLSMDGGWRNRRAYRAINGTDCLATKRAAFAALVNHKPGRVCLTAMVIRNLNEDVIPQILALANKHPDVVRYVHFRNAVSLGGALSSAPYTIKELKDLVGRYFTPIQMQPACLGEPHCPPESGRTCCCRFRPTPRLQVSLIEFVSPRSVWCPQRGRLVLGEDRIRPCFASMLASGEQLDRLWQKTSGCVHDPQHADY